MPRGKGRHDVSTPPENVAVCSLQTDTGSRAVRLWRVRTLRVKVKPNSRVEEFVALADGGFEARVKSPPVDGKANAALIALIASHFGLRKAQVSIKSGTSGRLKLVRIEE